MFWPRALILAAALTTVALGAAAAEIFPVRWSPSLGLGALDDLERRREEPLWDAAGILLARKWRYVGEGQASEAVEPRRIVSCSDYWAVDLARLITRSQSDHNLLGEFAADCSALKALGLAKPATESFVSDFSLDERAVDVLPAAVAIAIGPVERREIEDADAKGWSWRQWHESRASGLVAVHEAADGSATFEWARGKSRMEIHAWGDFNGDGAEDLMLRVSEWPGYAHTSRSKTFLVTRRHRQAVMRALPWPWAGGD